MKSLMLLLALGLAASDKLDRTYLPPPGSKFAGGEPGDLQVPLEFPKETYTTTAPFRQGLKDNINPTFGDTRLVPGSQRTGSNYPVPSDTVPVTPSNRPPFNYYHSKVPTTTTSYAFTQTTTFPPNDGFETTPNPVFPVDGSIGDQASFNNQPFNQGQIYDQQTGQIHYVQPGNQNLQKPELISPIGTILPGGQVPYSSNQPINGQSVYKQGQIVNQNQPGVVSTISPISSNRYQPGLVTSPYNQGYTQHLGVQPPRQGFIPSTTAAPGYQNEYLSQYKDNIPNNQGIKVIGQQPSVFPSLGPQQGTTQYIDKYGNVQSSVVPGVTIYQPVQPTQNHQPQSSESQQNFENLQSIGQQRFPSSNNLPEINTVTGFSSLIPGQQGNERPQFPGQQVIEQTSSLPQQTNTFGGLGTLQQQYGGQQGSYLQQPQSVIPQNNFPATGPSQGPIEFGSQEVTPNLGSHHQIGGQRPTTIAQQSQYPLNPVTGQVATNIQSRPQNIGLQGTTIPGQGNYQQSGTQKPQSIGEQGTIIPGQITYPQLEGKQRPQNIGQQVSYPSTPFSGRPQNLGQQQSTIPIYQQNPFSSTINTQVPTIPGQTDLQQTVQPTFPTTGIANNFPLNPTSTQSTTIPGFNLFSGQQPVVGNLPGNRQFGETQVTDNGISTQSIVSRPGQQTEITGSPQSTYGPGSITLPTNSQRPFPSSTTPSSGTSYGTTPGSIYSPTTPYPDLESGVSYTANMKPLPERPQAASDRNAVILNYENVLTPDGFAYSFDTSNGIHADENGTAIGGVKADGSYSYIGDDGKLYSVVYTADENGFRPHGDHIPTPPPVPKAIQQIIEQAAKDREAGISHDGFYDEAKYGHHKYQKPKHRLPKPKDKSINEADKSDKYENSDEKRKYNQYDKYDNNKNPISSEDEEAISEYDDNDNTKSKNNKVSAPTAFNKKNPFESLEPRKPHGQLIYDNEQDYDQITTTNKKLAHQLHDERTDKKRPHASSQDILRHRPNFDKGKPISSKDESVDSQSYEELPEENIENGNNKFRYYNNSVNPKKSTANKYSSHENDGQQSVSPGFFNSDKQAVDGPSISENYYDRRKTTTKDPRPTKPMKNIFKMKYNIAEDQSGEEPISDQEDESVVSGFKDKKKNRPPQTRNKYNYKQKPKNYYGSQHDYSHSTEGSAGSRFEQSTKPSNEQYDEEDAERNDSQLIEDGVTGYRYTPPKNKFDQTISRFPSRFSETTTPTIKYENDNKDTTVQPFITPNVHRNEEQSYEDVSEENIPLEESTKPDRKGASEYETIDGDNSEYIENEGEPESKNDENVRTTKTRPAVVTEKTGLNYQPDVSSSQPTRKPAYGEEYTTESENESPSQSPQKHGQQVGDRYPTNSGRHRLRGKPGQNYPQTTIETSRTPSFTYVSSTTPMPFRKPFQSTPKQPSFSTSYEPSYITNMEYDNTEDSMEPGHFTTKATSKRPSDVYSISKNDSRIRPDMKSTSNPSYDYSDGTMMTVSPTIRPGISDSAFSRHSVRPGGLNKPSYSSVTSKKITGSPRRPVSSAGKNYDRSKPEIVTSYSESDMSEETKYPDKPKLTRPQQIGTPGRQDLPSTTYRPNYPIAGIFRPGSENVNAFRRPIQAGRGTMRPDFTASPENEISDGSPNYQDAGVVKEEQPVTTFKPTEARFGSPPQGNAGLKPAEFGPSAFTTPGYLSPYGPSNGKVIGEDFSGPKQPQKFDPKTGYYY